MRAFPYKTWEQKRPNNPKETNQKPAGGFLIAHFKR